MVPSGIANAEGLSQTYVSEAANHVAHYQTIFVLAIHMLEVEGGLTVWLVFRKFIIKYWLEKTGAHLIFFRTCKFYIYLYIRTDRNIVEHFEHSFIHIM